ncbi:hypothetical protein BSKO_14127 [Bryopsis sp. KO-2023]|nr:hypothetical protein BSKO_14127 [Bryopsis sp. KO-2023]
MGVCTRSEQLCVFFVMAATAASFASGFSISVITVTPSIRARGKFLAKNEALDILRATGSVADAAISLLESVTKGSMKIPAGSSSPPLPAGCSVSVQNFLGLVQLNSQPISSTGTISPMAVVIRADVKGAQTHIFFDIKDDSLPAFRENVKSICPPVAPPHGPPPPAAPKKGPPPASPPAPPTTVTTRFSAGLSTTNQGGSGAKVKTDGDFSVQSGGNSVSAAFGSTRAGASTNQGQISTSSRTGALANGEAGQATQTIALNAEGVGLGEGSATSLVSTQLGSPVLGRSALPTTASSNSNFVVFGTPFKVDGLLTDTAQSGTLPPVNFPG